MQSVRTSWWLIALRGLIAVIFGTLALVWPAETATAIVLLIAIFVILDGVLSLVAAVRARQPTWGFGAFEGVLGLVVGILALAWPQATAMIIAVLVGVWALLTGILELAAAIRLRREIRSVWLLGIAGVVSVIFGIAILASPSAGVVVLTTLVGIYAILFGLAIIFYGAVIRRLS